jgi:hypothetical protein
MRPQRSQLLPWFSVLCFALLAALEIGTVARQGGIGNVLQVVFGVPLVLVFVLAYIDLLDFLRTRAARRAHPGEFVASIVAYQELRPQLNRVTSLLKLPPQKVRMMRYFSLVVTSMGFSLLGGVIQPKTYFSASGLRLIDAKIVRVPQGKWTLSCLELEYEVGKTTVILDFALMQVRFGIPGEMRAKVLEGALADVRQLITVSA